VRSERSKHIIPNGRVAPPQPQPATWLPGDLPSWRLRLGPLRDGQQGGMVYTGRDPADRGENAQPAGGSAHIPSQQADAEPSDLRDECRICSAVHDHDEWNAAERGETPLQRADRAYGEILQEVRVAQTGVQILFAFLLALAFQARFGSTTNLQRDLYGVT